MPAVSTRALAVGLATFVAIVLHHGSAAADLHDVNLDEVMAGLDGDATVQFVRVTQFASGQKCQGTGQHIAFDTRLPCVTSGVGAQLVFFNASGVQTNTFIFPMNTPVGESGRSILIATQQFADLSTMPQPDFIMPANVVPTSGKVCYRNRVGAPFSVNLCLSYGSFTGNTENGTAPAPALPITGNFSLRRTKTSLFGNSAFTLGTPAPSNNCGEVSGSSRCLIVSKAGQTQRTANMQGTVTSIPTGTTCTASCPETSAAFPTNTVVTLSFSPSSGTRFVGWSGGGCSGTGTCTVTLSAATSVTATFDQPTLVAAVLPSSRSVQVGSPATVFATIINSVTTPATGVRIQLKSAMPATLDFQTTDSTTNQVTGTINTAVDIAAGKSQSFVIAITASAPFSATDVEFVFGGTSSSPVSTVTGLNTLLLSASATPVPDIVALAGTLTNDGIVNIPGATGTGAFVVATFNVGASGSITASADTGGVTVSATLVICETVAATGVCKAPPSASVTRTVGASETPTYGIFVTGSGAVAFGPGVNRIFVRFKDAAGETRGATSVAVRTP